jgi:predicted branched-subunit amino acid permease
MDDNNKNMTDKDLEAEDKDKIVWFGLDGALVLLFIILVVTMFCSLYFKINVLNGYVFPILLLIAVIVITVKYAMTLGGFIKIQNQVIKDNQARKSENAKNNNGDI